MELDPTVASQKIISKAQAPNKTTHSRNNQCKQNFRNRTITPNSDLLSL